MSARWRSGLLARVGPIVAAAVGVWPLAAQPVVVGHAGVEARFFFADARTGEQPRRLSLSAKLQPEVTQAVGDELNFRGIVRLRLDQSDPQRSYVDLREAMLQWDHGPLTVRVGLNTVFWGVTESRHLVNIVNQTDYLDDLDGDEKFGQLMALVTYDLAGLGFADVFAMTWARPQLYPSQEGRPGVPDPVLDDSPVYESGWRAWHVDTAVRWYHSLDALDWAVSYFHGTSREPELIPSGSLAERTLRPRYDVIDQAGLELQWTSGDWLWKAEGIVRAGQGPVFAAVTGGFEHTTVGLFGTDADLGTLLEYSYDGRDNLTYNIHDQDLFGGVRVSLNDVQGSEILAGILRDLESSVTLGTLEASRRLGDAWRLELIARLFQSAEQGDPVYWFRRDDYVQATLEYHF